jgi:hypothetical protein
VAWPTVGRRSSRLPQRRLLEELLVASMAGTIWFPNVANVFSKCSSHFRCMLQVFHDSHRRESGISNLIPSIPESGAGEPLLSVLERNTDEPLTSVPVFDCRSTTAPVTICTRASGRGPRTGHQVRCRSPRLGGRASCCWG